MNRVADLMTRVALACLPITAVADPRYATVEALGALNGVALHCRYLDQVSRMKAAVVDNAPKERSFGLAFDESTHEAFLAFIQRGATCPGKAGFSGQVETAIIELRRAFGKE
jgi:hypothetical protein